MTLQHEPWVDERVEALKRLAAEGLSAAQIAEHIGGTTKSAIIGQCQRRQIPLLRAHGRDTGEFRDRRNRLTRTVAPLAPLAPWVPDADVPASQRRSLEQLTTHTCRWPIGDPGEPGFFFCGAAPESGRPYCHKHCCVAYRKDEPDAMQQSR